MHIKSDTHAHTHKYTRSRLCHLLQQCQWWSKRPPTCKHNKAWIRLNFNWPPHQSIHVKAGGHLISFFIYNRVYVCKWPLRCRGICVPWLDDICGDSSDIWRDERQTVKGGLLNTVQGPNLAWLRMMKKNICSKVRKHAVLSSLFCLYRYKGMLSMHMCVFVD